MKMIPIARAAPWLAWPEITSPFNRFPINIGISGMVPLVMASAVAKAEKALPKSKKSEERKAGPIIGIRMWRRYLKVFPPNVTFASYHSARMCSTVGIKMISIRGIWKKQ